MISDEVFEKAINNPDNANIIQSVCNQYRDSLSEDILESCGFQGLLDCLEKHDDKFDRKFTTSLFEFVRWRCLNKIREQPPAKTGTPTNDIPSNELPVLDRLIIHEYLQKLTKKQRTVIEGKYFEGKSLTEIATELVCSVQNVHQIKGRALERLRQLHLE
jgi:RNA polymerase sigma factor (sigma-70 family)